MDFYTEQNSKIFDQMDTVSNLFEKNKAKINDLEKELKSYKEASKIHKIQELSKIEEISRN